MITDQKLDYEKGKYFAGRIEDEYGKRFPEDHEKHFFIVKSITYFCWNNKPAYFVFLLSDNGKTYRELVVTEVDDGSGYGNFLTEWDLAGHGYPACSNEVWREEDE